MKLRYTPPEPPDDEPRKRTPKPTSIRADAELTKQLRAARIKPREAIADGPDITSQRVERQLDVMNCDRYELGLHDHASNKTQIIECDRAWIVANLAMLKARNAGGESVWIRPAGSTGLVLIDDLHADAVERLRADGHAVALVVETSPGNLQAWVRLCDGALDQAVSTAARLDLAHTYGGDPGSADWRHFGRLAGFVQRKPRREPLYVKLVSGRKVQSGPAAEMLLSRVRQALEQVREAPTTPTAEGRLSRPQEGVAGGVAPPPPVTDAIAEYMRQLRAIESRGSIDDMSRGDWMIGCDMARRGYSAVDIAAAIEIASPDIARRKGGAAGARRYADHTAEKCVDAVAPKSRTIRLMMPEEETPPVTVEAPSITAETVLTRYLGPKNDRQRKEVSDELKSWKAFAGDASMSDAQAFAAMIDGGSTRIDAYLEHELGRGLTKATVNNKRSRLRRLVEFAQAEGLASWSVQSATAARTPKPERVRREVKPISPATELVEISSSSSTLETSPAIAADLEMQSRQLMCDWLATPRFKPGTVRAYAQSVIALQESVNANAPEEAIAQLLTQGQELCDRFRADLERREYAPKTIRLHMCALASLVRAARERGLTSCTIQTSWKHAQPKKDMSGPDPNQLRDAIAALHRRAGYPRRRVAAVRDIAILELASRSGLRVSEIAGLELRHVVEHGGTVEVWPKRKGSDLRVGIQIEGAALDALREYLAVRGDRPGSLWLLADARGELSDTAMTEHRMRDMVRSLGLRRVGDPSHVVGIHGLRHLAAQEAYAAGGLDAAAEVLGHRDRRNRESTKDYILR